MICKEESLEIKFHLIPNSRFKSDTLEEPPFMKMQIAASCFNYRL